GFTPPELLPEWQRQVAPEGYTNLGLAHGVPGVIAILARYITAGVDVARARVLLEAGVDYLRYVAWLPSQPNSQARVAWCYGDLGVAIALMSAGTALGRDDWRRDALDLAR